MKVYGLIAFLVILCWAELSCSRRGNVSTGSTSNGTRSTVREQYILQLISTTQSSAPQSTTQSNISLKSTTQESPIVLPATGDPVCSAQTVNGHPLLPEAAVGANITTKCYSGVFEGRWTCVLLDDGLGAKWKLINCTMPSSLDFLSTPDSLVTDQKRAIWGVRELIRTRGFSSYHLANEVIAEITRALSMRQKLRLNSENVTNYLETYGHLLSSLPSSRGRNETVTKESDQLVNGIFKQLDIFASKLPHTDSFETSSIKLKVHTLNSSSKDAIGFKAGGDSIFLPVSELLQTLNLTSARAASFYFKDVSNILSANVISPVISTTLFCGEKLCNTSHTNLKKHVQVMLHHTNVQEEQGHAALCSFFVKLPESDSWEQRGCFLNHSLSNSSVSVCECDHLTHFAILLSPGANFSDSDELALRSIGYIGVSISLVGMTVTILILSCIKSLWGIRNFIHINLCATLMAAQLLFVVGVDRTENRIVCSVIAVVLEYLFLSSFMWMLMEGVVLYILLVIVFIHGKERKYCIQFAVFSYGAPALYMCLVTPLGYISGDEWGFGTDSYCWLSYETNFIWTFIIPVLITILINVYFFILTIKAMRSQKDKIRISVKSWLQMAISLTVVMGLTWIVGILVVHEYLISFAYIFTIFVAFQGLAIFILFICLSKQVRDSLGQLVSTKILYKSKFLRKHLGLALPLHKSSKGENTQRIAGGKKKSTDDIISQQNSESSKSSTLPSTQFADQQPSIEQKSGRSSLTMTV